MSIIFLGGYSNAGKTTFLNVAEQMGCKVASTSQHLDWVAASLYKALAYHTDLHLDYDERKIVDLLRAKNNAILGLDARQFKIITAEKVLVPLFGRKKALVEPVAKRALALSSEGYTVFVETIGDNPAMDIWEYSMFREFIKDYNAYNIRRIDENPSADYRGLLEDGTDIWNRAESGEGWAKQVESIFSTIGFSGERIFLSKEDSEVFLRGIQNDG